jgi:hypothetical protein
VVEITAKGTRTRKTLRKKAAGNMKLAAYGQSQRKPRDSKKSGVAVTKYKMET